MVWTLAPSWTQVRDLLWRDIEDLYNKSDPRLGGRLSTGSCRWDFGPRRYALGRSTNKAEKLQGPHGGHLLIIIDEASGFPDVLEPAVEGMMASGDARLLMLSQPTRLSGMFYNACHKGKAMHNVIHMDAFEMPNFGPEGITRPYLILPDWVELMRAKWGERSPLWQIRVRGQFPAQASDSIISISWVEEAFMRQVGKRPPGEPRPMRVLGCDVARFGTDYTAYAKLEGNVLRKVWRRSGKSLMETANELARAYKQDPDINIVLDDTGLGGGVVDRLRELGVPVRSVNFGARAEESNDYANKATEMWFQLGKALENGELSFDDSIGEEDRDVLTAQLIQPVYTYTGKGQMKVDKLGGEATENSPDLGDALALAYEGLRNGMFTAAGGSVEPELFSDRRNLFGAVPGQNALVLPSATKGAWRRMG